MGLTQRDTPRLPSSRDTSDAPAMIPRMGRLTRTSRALATSKDYAQAVTAAASDSSAVTASATDLSDIPLASPWSEPLPSIVWRDLYGDNAGAVTRGSAMRLGPVRRARNFVVSTLSGLPLVSLGLGERVPLPAHYASWDDYVAALAAFRDAQPTWLYRSDDGASPQHRMAWTLDDLIFHPASLWERTPSTADRFPLNAQRVNRDRWKINTDNRVEIDGDVKSDEEVILIPGLTSGILTDGVDILRDARYLAEIVRKRLRNPAPTMNLQQTGGEDLNKDERRELVEGWAAARQGENGGVAFSNRFIKPEELGGNMDAQLMIEGRNASAVDQARLVGVSASRVDASGVNSTLSYETESGRYESDVLDLRLYTLPIEARLSMDDCVPRGRRVVFDRSDLTALDPSPTGPNRQD